MIEGMHFWNSHIKTIEDIRKELDLIVGGAYDPDTIAGPLINIIYELTGILQAYTEGTDDD